MWNDTIWYKCAWTTLIWPFQALVFQPERMPRLAMVLQQAVCYHCKLYKVPHHWPTGTHF